MVFRKSNYFSLPLKLLVLRRKTVMIFEFVLPFVFSNFLFNVKRRSMNSLLCLCVRSFRLNFFHTVPPEKSINRGPLRDMSIPR